MVHFPPLNLAFGTAPLSLQQWAVCVGWRAACCGWGRCARG
ncbi:hypothetical protein [Roseateles sp. P5_E4]